MKMPDILIYNPKGTNLFRMICTKDRKVVGKMVAYPSSDSRLYIDELTIFSNRRQGLGTKFLNFAKSLSKSWGFDGKMILNATTTPYDPHNPPHIFYRKFGFTTNDKKMLKKIDKYIKTGKQLDYKKTPDLIMYYPDTVSKKLTFWQKLKNFLKI